MRSSLVNLLYFWATKQPQRVALESRIYRLTYKELFLSIQDTIILNHNANDFIGLVFFDQVLYTIVMLYCLKNKIKFVTINPAIKINDFIEKHHISKIVTDIKHINISQCAVVYYSYYKDLSFISKASLVDSYSFESPAGCFCTSGSTGIPKIYTRTQYSLISEALLWIMEMDISRKSSVFISKNCAYIGSYVLLFSTLYAGGKIFFSSDENYLDDLSLKKMQLALLTPDLIRIYNKTDCSSKILVTNAITMGDYISKEDKIAFVRKSKINLYEMWGNSEGLATLYKFKVNLKDGYIGKATFTDSLFIVDKNSNILQPGKVGFIAGITDNGTNEIAEVIISEDLGYQDSKGNFYLLGRTEKVIWNDKDYISLEELKNEIMNKYKITTIEILNFDEIVAVYIAKKHKKLFSDIKNDILQQIKEINQDVKLNLYEIERIPYNANGKLSISQLKEYISMSITD